MVALIEATQDDTYPAEIKLVISNRPEAAGLRKADEMGVNAICIDHRDFETRADFELDEGKIIAQSSLSIETVDTPETLAKRVQKLEHTIYPKALADALRNN